MVIGERGGEREGEEEEEKGQGLAEEEKGPEGEGEEEDIRHRSPKCFAVSTPPLPEHPQPSLPRSCSCQPGVPTRPRC